MTEEQLIPTQIKLTQADRDWLRSQGEMASVIRQLIAYGRQLTLLFPAPERIDSTARHKRPND